MEDQSIQGSESWLSWRKKGIGASEAAAVLGISPYKTRYQLWEEKLDLCKPFEGNWATRRGNELEPKARSLYELQYGIEMPPAIAEHKDYPFIRASFDGYNEKLGIVLEIKCAGKEDHSLAISGKVPEKYYPQVQQQLLISGAKEAHYYSYNGTTGALVIVKPDIEYCTKLLSELISFWKLVLTKVPPELDPERDYEVIADESLIKYTQKWKELKTLIDGFEQEKKHIESLIKSGLQVPRAICVGVRFTKTYRKGAVDYAKIPELKDIDLEQYRKDSSEIFTMRMLKDDE